MLIAPRIVQERILAPRMLHFSNYGLFWECAKLRPASEFMPLGTISQLPGSHIVADYGLFNSRSSGVLPGYLPRGGQGACKSPYLVFENAFKIYTRSRLSFPDKDRLIAFSGVVSRVSELMNDKYCNGFLESELPYALCWTVFP